MKNISKTNWEFVDNLKDEDIDYEDHPEVTEEFFKIMQAREPNKKGVFIKLDTELISFFKNHSKHYQTKINDVLRAYKHAFEKRKIAH
jgi:uncharacterized protein (DUF4415 family)